MSFFENYNHFLQHFKNKNIENFDDIKNIATISSFLIDNNEHHDNNKILPSKKVKSIRQLKNIEKEVVRLNYKEAVLKGLGNNTLDIQKYILYKTKIFVEKSGIEYLKKSEELENQNWFYNLKNDHLSFIYVYKKAIDEIDQQKADLWVIFENPKTTVMLKIKIIRELHKLTITSTQLLKDLPFVTDLSNYYNLSN